MRAVACRMDESRASDHAGHAGHAGHAHAAGGTSADGVWLAATWPFVRGQLPPPPGRVIELGCGPVGGSHAQRDVIDLTLIAGAARAGDHHLTRALVTERVTRKPSAEASARQLVTENGGSADALRW